ncbi:immunoglobulin lambda-1 light chain-like [Puntigrus tetrazona]|uniref:immunoglobulin lambda-1 light chain-like n=1 Tax=Puntigrus tetrazona TaxID=1606681 RepID=UPI001C898CD5|nr:immunoglobulin lambda-1 light chain-like [Puntigrus tetrazona]
MITILCAFFTLLSCVSGVTGVTQSPLISVNEGQTAQLDCNLGTVTDASAQWYKQTPGGAPQYVLRFYHGWGSPSYGSGFSAPKFTSTHSSQSDYRLIISNVDVSDSAVYYCQTWDSSVSENVFGQGTKLNVIDSPLSRPVLTLLSPSAEALKESKVTLVCLAEDVSVPLVHVTWSVNGRSVTDGVWNSPTEKQPDKRFKMSSSLSVESSVWTNDADFSCEVSVGSESAKKSISVSRCGTTA